MRILVGPIPHDEQGLHVNHRVTVDTEDQQLATELAMVFSIAILPESPSFYCICRPECGLPAALPGAMYSPHGGRHHAALSR